MRYFPLCLSFFFLFACTAEKVVSDPYAHIKDQKVVATLKKSFKTLGGLENWHNKKELHYKKHTVSLLESGEIEFDIRQTHDYFYGETTNINITSKDSENRPTKITSIDGNAMKYVDGVADKSADTNALNNSVLTSLFVIGVPFKLLDKGIDLSHEGMDNLEDGQKVEVIKAVYDADKNTHHTKSDIWWYYFDAKDGRMVGYFIKHDDHYSYVKNLDYTKVGSFILPTKRGSYRIDEDRNIQYTKAKYEYTDWEVKE